MLGAAAVLAGSMLAACGSSGPSLVLYNGQHEQTTDALVAAFERQTGITVEVRSGDEDELAEAIAADGSRSPADVIYTENSQALEFLQERGLLARVDAGTLASIPSRYDSPRGDWVGVSARVSVLVYNPALIRATALPTQILQLADPRYRGELGVAPSESDFQPIVTAVARRYGTAAALHWLDGLRTNSIGHVYDDNESLTANVNDKAVAFGLVNQYYFYRLRAEIGAANVTARIAYLAPDDPGYVVDVSGAAVLRSSEHQSAAQRFVAFLVSAQGQRIIAHSFSFEYPVRPGVAASPQEPPFASLRPNPITVAELGNGSAAVALLRQSGLL